MSKGFTEDPAHHLWTTDGFPGLLHSFSPDATLLGEVILQEKKTGSPEMLMQVLEGHTVPGLDPGR